MKPKFERTNDPTRTTECRSFHAITISAITISAINISQCLAAAWAAASQHTLVVWRSLATTHVHLSVGRALLCACIARVAIGARVESSLARILMRVISARDPVVSTRHGSRENRRTRTGALQQEVARPPRVAVSDTYKFWMV